MFRNTFNLTYQIALKEHKKGAKMITEKDIGRNVIVNGYVLGCKFQNMPGIIVSAEYNNKVDVKSDNGAMHSLKVPSLAFVDDENKKESTRRVKEGYEKLDAVLYDAISQSQDGKGAIRHATNNNYEDQVICVVGRLLKGHPFGAHAYQIIKKTIEAGRLYQIKGQEAAYQEMLGSINYAAAMCILIKEGEK